MHYFLEYLGLTVLFFLSTTSYASDKECWNESKACAFTGTLETQIYPGPPNYEDITKGDEKEEGLYLRLDQPIKIHFKDWNDDKKIEVLATEFISLLQVAGEFDTNRFYKLAETKKKTHVTIRGSIFESFNGHHHTHFLVDPDNHIVVDKK